MLHIMPWEKTYSHTSIHLHAVTHFPSHYYTNSISNAHSISHIHKIMRHVDGGDVIHVRGHHVDQQTRALYIQYWFSSSCDTDEPLFD